MNHTLKFVQVMGFTTELLFVMMANVEARQQLLAHAPAGVLMLVERAFSTDDLEAEFGLLVRGCGFKPSYETALGFQEKADFLYHVRRVGQEKYGLVIPKSTKCHALLVARRHNHGRQDMERCMGGT